MSQEKELRSARMSVGWVCGASREFKDSIGNTLTIESWELSQACLRDLENSGKATQKGTHASKCEEIPINIGDIRRDYEVCEDVWISRYCHLDAGK